MTLGGASAGQYLSSGTLGGATANLRTNIMDFRGFDSSVILLVKGGIPRRIGDFREVLSQVVLVGIMSVGRLGVHRVSLCLRGANFGKGRQGSALMGSLRIFMFCCSEGPLGYSRYYTFIFPKLLGRTFFSNLSTNNTLAAAPLVLTPFVRNQKIQTPIQLNRIAM